MRLNRPEARIGILVVGAAAALINGWPLHPSAGAPRKPAAGRTEVLATHPVPQLPTTFGSPEWVSPDARFAVFQSDGSGSGESDLHVVDLRGKHPRVDLRYANYPAFVPGGMTYWSYNSHGSLYLLNLQTGRSTQLYPRGGKDVTTDDFLATGAAWNPTRRELFAVRQTSENRSLLYVLRLRDGRPRRLGMEVDEVRFSPDFRRLACVRQGPLQGTDVWLSQVWTTAADGTDRRALTTGRLFGWTDESHLLVTRAGTARPEQGIALFRADVHTGELRYLAEYPTGTPAMLSPSRRWVAVATGRSVKLISAENGLWSPVDAPEVTGLFWGRTDGELYLGSKTGWRKIELPIGPGTMAAALPVPERIPVRPGSGEVAAWHQLAAPSRQWSVHRATVAPRSAARVGNATWIGTTDGLKILDGKGEARILPSWARGLAGRSVEAIVPDGPRVWLVTRRVAPFNGRNSWESAMVRVDLPTGTARQRYLEPSGFGDDQYLTGLIPGESPLTVEAPQHAARLWGREGSTRLEDPVDEQPLSAREAVRGQDGAVWLGTDSGLVHWRPGESRAIAWTEKQGLAAAAVLSVAEYRGRIWLGTAAGLSVLAPQTGQVQRLTASETLGRQPVLQLLVSGNQLYARGKDWLAELSPRTGAWSRWPAVSLTRLSTNGHLLGRFGEPAMLREWSGQGHWKPLLVAGRPGMAADTTSSLLWQEGALWCGHPHSVSRLDLQTGSWLRAFLPRGAFQVQRLLQAYGSLWVGLWKGGLLELDPVTGALRRRYLKVAGEEKHPDEDSHLIVYDLLADGDDLLANTSQGWHRIDRKSGHARLLPSGVQGHVVGKVGRTLWLLGDRVTMGGAPGLTELELPGLTATPHRSFPEAPAEASALDPAGVVWSVGSEVVGRNRDGKAVSRYPVPRRYRDLSVQAVAWSSGYLWYAAEGQESPVPYQPVFLRLRLADGVWQELPPCPLSGVRRLLVAGNSLWVATWNGVAQLPLNAYSPPSLPHPERAALPPEKEVFSAIRHRDLPELKALLDAGLPVDVRGRGRTTPLMTSAATGWAEGARLLLERGANANLADHEGGTPLYFGLPSVELVKLLLEHGARPNVRAPSTRSPLLMNALWERHDEVARLLIAAGADVNAGASPEYQPLHAAIPFGSAELVKLLLKQGADQEARDAYGNTPLLLAFTSGKPGMVETLLEAGANVNARNKLGDTALNLAAALSRNNLIGDLLAKGAKLEVARNNGWTPLLSAAARVNHEGFLLLLAAGADPNARSATGQTALMFAARFGDLQGAQFLLKQGADPTFQDKSGATALSIAKEGQNPELVRLLEQAQRPSEG